MDNKVNEIEPKEQVGAAEEQEKPAETEEQVVPVAEEQEKLKQQAGRKKKKSIIIAASVILIALLAGIGIYNMPANRLTRQLELGYKYLEEEAYEEAAIAFEQAIAIDERCMDAYVGGVEAYLGAGDIEGAWDFYDRTLDVLSRLDEEFVAENIDSIVEIYLASDKVYGEDRDKIAQVLEEGFAVAGEEPRVKDKLIKNYIQMGKEQTGDGSYKDALVIYDRLLELDSTNSETIRDLCSCLNKYIDILMEEKQYDAIRALAEKYKDFASDVDFTAILARIAELEKIEAENRAFMQKVYDLLTAQDYEAMREVDDSEEANAFVERMDSDRYLYFPDSNNSSSGTGAGVYLFGDGGYYFYYGDFEAGERKGSGDIFMEYYGTGYYLFEGIWDKDAPNGEGTLTLMNGISITGSTPYDKVTKGLLVDGLWDGHVDAVLTDGQNDEKYDLSFDAVNGIPTEDRTNDFLSKVWFAEPVEEGYYVVAYDYHSNINWAWWNMAKEGGAAGIVGFADNY